MEDQAPIATLAADHVSQQLRCHGNCLTVRYSVSHDGKITYPEEPECEAESASLCSTTTFRSETIQGPSTSTVTRVSSDCETIYGCSATDWETVTQTYASVCPLPTKKSKRDPDEPKLQARDSRSPGCPDNAIVYPKDPKNVGEVPKLLKEYDYKTIKSTTHNFVAFYWVPMLDNVTMAALEDSVSAATDSNFVLEAILTGEKG